MALFFSESSSALKFHFKFFVCSLALTFLAPTLRAEIELSSSTWTRPARDLFTGDETKALASKEWFDNHPGAIESLIRGLGDPEEEHLALDTLVALGRREIVPLLLNQLVTNADGSYALALAALMNSENAELILRRFRRLIESDTGGRLSPSLTLPVLDTLARLHVPLTSESFSRLASHYWPEIRLSLVNYLRENAREKAPPFPSWLYIRLLSDRTYQVRLAALSLHSEFPQSFSKDSAVKACLNETHDLIQLYCRRFILPEAAL